MMVRKKFDLSLLVEGEVVMIMAREEYVKERENGREEWIRNERVKNEELRMI